MSLYGTEWRERGYRLSVRKQIRIDVALPDPVPVAINLAKINISLHIF
jgi:hypothetical protein